MLPRLRALGLEPSPTPVRYSQLPFLGEDTSMPRSNTVLASSAATILMAVAGSPASAATNCADLASMKIAASEIGLPSRGAIMGSAQLATVPADPQNPGATRDYCQVLGAVLPVDPN